MSSQVVAVHSDGQHAFSKQTTAEIELIEGHGVQGDSHYGVSVQHRSRVARDPTQPNLRQVHLLHDELLTELREKDFDLQPGQLGENITTRGLAVLALSEGTTLKIGAQAVLRVTGLRNPCSQIEGFRSGLLAAVVDRASDGTLIRKAGVMCVVEQSGVVRAGDTIVVLSRPANHVPLQPV